MTKVGCSPYLSATMLGILCCQTIPGSWMPPGAQWWYSGRGLVPVARASGPISFGWSGMRRLPTPAAGQRYQQASSPPVALDRTRLPTSPKAGLRKLDGGPGILAEPAAQVQDHPAGLGG